MSSSHFANSHNILSGSTFITAQSYQCYNSPMFSNAELAFEVLHTNIAADALHNSDERCDAPKCLRETRVALQEELLSWIAHGETDDVPKRITWLTGPAGSGKTAIAGTIAEICHDRGLLAGSFFFSSYSGSERRRSKRSLIATLAYGFLQHDSLQALRGAILSPIERDPSIFLKQLGEQSKSLLLKPFHGAAGQLDPPSLPKIIIIDGLDEVTAEGSQYFERGEQRKTSEEHQVEILGCLLQAANDPTFPFRILIASRPERVIRSFFSERAADVTREIFLDEKYRPDADIALFLKTKFAEIRRRYRIPSSWPTQAAIDALIDKASGQFIYVATVIRFLELGGLPPQQLLDCILKLPSQNHTRNAFARLDALYTHILASSPDPRLAVQWLGAINGPLKGAPTRFVRQLLSDFEGQADYLLDNLGSLVKMPTSEKEGTLLYGMYHKSLPDFLESDRCAEELRLSFLSGEDFFCRRYFDILVSKRPIIQLPGAEWQVFCSHLLALYSEMSSASRNDGESLQHHLAQWDVSWWILVLQEMTIAPEVVACWFNLLHSQCINEVQGTDCPDYCTSWRNRIFQACKDGGWRVPEPVVFLRELVVNSELGGREFDFEDHFEASSPLKPPHGPPPLEDYAWLHQRAKDVHSRLPHDWETNCKYWDPKFDLSKLKRGERANEALAEPSPTSGVPTDSERHESRPAGLVRFAGKVQERMRRGFRF